jgi:hypothetical protein
MDFKMMSAIIDALRQSPSGQRRVYKGGQLSRTEQSPLFGNRNVVQQTGDDVGYTKYVRMSERMGETPVSFEEWMAGR